ncbi:Clp protease ClpP [Sesbania bispinosa]|nr:Clp protease ClpP [Sesbania bispinosa]
MKRQCLANAKKDKVGAGSSTDVPVASNVAVKEVVVHSSSVVASRKHGRTERASATVAEQSLKDMTVERDSLKTGLYKEKLKVKAAEEKYNTDFQQLNVDARRSYGLGFEKALIQAKHFNPIVDV